MNLPTQDSATRSLITAIEANTLQYYANFRHLPGATLVETEHVRLVMTRHMIDLFNGVLWANFQTPTIEEQIEAALEPFKRHNLPLLWHIGPSTQPDDLGRHLLRHGIRHVEDEPGMAVDLYAANVDHVPVAGLAIVPVKDRAALRQWIDVWAFPLSEDGKQRLADVYAQLGFDPHRPLRHYLGMLDGEPVATSAIYEGAGVASVQHVVTLPMVRRRGVGAAMTVHVLQEARVRGYRTAVLTASPDGINIYRRLGFREYCTMSTYTWTPPQR